VRKNAPIIGKTVSEAAFQAKYGVIVVGAELAGKKAAGTGCHTTLGELELGPGDLLVFTARKLSYLATAHCDTAAEKFKMRMLAIQSD
jgi:Trk K+ transport system NAD-binding subunit